MKHPAASISERSITISLFFPRWREPTYLLRKLALEWSEPGEEDQVATKATPTVMLFLPRLTPTVMLSLLAAIHNFCANTHAAGEVSLHLNDFWCLKSQFCSFHIFHDILWGMYVIEMNMVLLKNIWEDKEIIGISCEVRSTVLRIDTMLHPRDWPRASAPKTRLPKFSVSPNTPSQHCLLSGRLWSPGKTYICRDLLRKASFQFRNRFAQWKVCWNSGMCCQIQEGCWFTGTHDNCSVNWYCSTAALSDTVVVGCTDVLMLGTLGEN